MSKRVVEVGQSWASEIIGVATGSDSIRPCFLS
jgi:hypothetical protein